MDRPSSIEAKIARTLERIALRNADVRAWTYVADQSALNAARELDRESGEPGPLHGLSVGVKDVVDVAGMPTRHNSPLGDARPALSDAPCVAVLRAAGAIILGKTDTTEFAAAGRNAGTGNPHDLTRTPGGSSAGSAAAVADQQADVAIATQTGGSTIRPASFCGVHALKPTWGLVSREGAKLYANSLDTIGFYAGDFTTLDRLCQVFDFEAPSPAASAPLKIGICRTPYWERAEPETKAALASAANRMTEIGVAVSEIELTPIFDRLERAFRVILFREGSAAFLSLARTSRQALHQDFHDRIASRSLMSNDELREAYDVTAEARREMERLMADTDGVVTPSAPGVAPEGRIPGDPIFNQMWTMLHLPCVNLPFFKGPKALPLGLTLTGRRFADRQLLQIAKTLEQAF